MIFQRLKKSIYLILLKLYSYCGDGTWNLEKLSDWQGHMWVSKSREDNLSLLVQHFQSRVKISSLRGPTQLWIPTSIQTSCMTWNKYLAFRGFSFLIWKTGMIMTTSQQVVLTTRWCELGLLSRWLPSPEHQAGFFFLISIFEKIQCYFLQIELAEVVQNLGSWFWVHWHFQLLYILSSHVLYSDYLRIVVRIKWEFK